MSEDVGALENSLTRYWSLIYLLAAIPLLLLAMNAPKAWAWLPATAMVITTAILGGHYVWDGWGTDESIRDIHDVRLMGEQEATELATVVPREAVVYSWYSDKVLWSWFDVATYPEPFEAERTAASIARAITAGDKVYLYKVREETIPLLDAELDSHGLRASVVQPDLYQVTEKFADVPELLTLYGCYEGATGPRDIADSEVRCFLGKRDDILDYYAKNGWDISPQYFGDLFRDWWEITSEREGFR